MKRITAQEITNRLIGQLESGTAPWVRPWNAPTPYNAKSKHKYSGVNYLFLAQDTEGPGYLTFTQTKDLGGHLKAGTVGRRIVFVARVNVKDRDNEGQRKSIGLMKEYVVFPVSSIENLPEQYYNQTVGIPVVPCDTAENIIDTLNPSLTFGGTRAFYSPTLDRIQLPERKTFLSNEAYYNTLFHELVHWTMHPARCNRTHSSERETYAKEELVAEIGAAMLANYCGLNVETMHLPDGTVSDNTAAYCASWAKAVSDSTANMITSAASKASEAVKFILKNVEVLEEVFAE